MLPFWVLKLDSDSFVTLPCKLRGLCFGLVKRFIQIPRSRLLDQGLVCLALAFVVLLTPRWPTKGLKPGCKGEMFSTSLLGVRAQNESWCHHCILNRSAGDLSLNSVS